MGHHHEGHDHHHHGPQDLSAINNAFYIGIALNTIFTIIEFVYGYIDNSLALLADASHNLSDVASLIISMIGMKLAQKAAQVSYTYGYKKASILASFINSVLLILIVFNILKEAVERFSAPPEIGGSTIIIVASIGVLINTVSAFLFFKGQKDDINIKGAFLHLMVDALVSVGVVISGVIIHYTGWNLIDPIISVIIGITILLTTWNLFRESLKLTLDGVPRGIKKEEVIQKVEKITGVDSIHHVHIWALSSSENAFTAHVVVSGEFSMKKWDELKHDIKHVLEHESIQHVTLELDGKNCKEKDCH